MNHKNLTLIINSDENFIKTSPRGKLYLVVDNSPKNNQKELSFEELMAVHLKNAILSAFNGQLKKDLVVRQ